MLRRVVCVLCTVLCALLVAGAPYIASNLPVPPEGMAALPYEGWSGVIRLRVYQGFRTGTGSLVPWLNSCLSTYEKRHSGVYVQVETVSLQTFSTLSTDEVPPDMVIFTPGALDNASCLEKLDISAAGISEGLIEACIWNGECRALPLCYGGYGILLNMDDMPLLPTADEWGSAISAQYRAATRTKKAHYALQVPGEGGWPDAARNLLGALPETGEQMPPDYLNCSMVKAWSDFKNGIAACIPASQWHLRQLYLLDCDGKAPNYTFYPSENGYTDQYFAAGVVAGSSKDHAARSRVCRDIIGYLMGEEAQSRLSLALAMPARADMNLYRNAGDMAALEAAYTNAAKFAPLFGE